MKKITDTIIPLPIENVDTDQIIPARFLKSITRIGFGDLLFSDWRYEKDGTPKKDFVLNNPAYQGKILVAGKNFGSGSSREHAAWAIAGYGFQVVVSSFFADIFKNNAMNNFILPVVVSEPFLGEIFDSVDRDPKMTLTVDLETQQITNNTTGKSETFAINAYKKECFLKGIDDIDYLLSKKELIINYETLRFVINNDVKVVHSF
jgi:3-isopropylmalate/(R)-2-methylmalate dehydratase small subunit